MTTIMVHNTNNGRTAIVGSTQSKFMQAEDYIQPLAEARADLIYFFDMTDEEYDLLFTPDGYAKFIAAMDDYARHAPTGTWYCRPEELNEPCPLDNQHCPVHDA